MGRVYKWTFFFYIAFISVVAPQSSSFVVGIIHVPLNYLMMLGLVLFAVPMMLHKAKRKQALKLWNCLALFFFITIVTVPFTNYSFDKQYIFYPLFMTFLSIAFAYAYSKISVDEHVDWKHMVTQFSIMLTGIYVLYASWFFLNLTGTGIIDRLKGPIGGAATIHFIMIPTLAVHLGNVMRRYKLSISVSCAILTGASLLMTGSRGAVLCAALFMTLFVLRKASMAKTFLAVVLVFITVSLGSQYIKMDRLKSFEDSARSQTMDITFSFLKESTPTVLLGKGYGGLFPWYIYDSVDSPFDRDSYENLVPTKYGYMLYHPHSLFLQAVGEFGIMGGLLFAAFLFMIVREYLWSRKDDDPLRPYLLMGIVASLPSVFFDLYIFKNWEVSTIWLFFLFVAFSRRQLSFSLNENPLPKYQKHKLPMGRVRRNEEKMVAEL